MKFFAVRVLMVFTGVCCTAYLVLRIQYSYAAQTPAMFWALWIAEFFGLTVSMLFFFNSWFLDSQRRAFDPLFRGTVAVLIPTVNEPENILFPTI